MTSEQTQELCKNINTLLENKYFTDKFIVVFGSNEPAERIIDYLEAHKVKVNAMVDNNEKKYSFTYHGIKVYQPEKLLSDFKQNAVILIASKFYQEMLKQLQRYGYNENEHVIQLVSFPTGTNYSIDDKTFQEEKELIRRGSLILANLKKEYGRDTMIFVFPWQAIGDIYISARYLKAYTKKNNIEKYLITVMGNSRKKVAIACGFPCVTALTEKESYELSRTVNFMGWKETNTMIVHHRYLYTNMIWRLGNYKGITFDDHYHYSIYGLDDKTEVVIPPKTGNIVYLQELFRQNDLIPEKTVILSPYANTITNPPEEFWVNLVKRLKENGYSVCTNSSGDNEPAIEGTKPVLFRFDVMLEAIEYAGVFIALRSGLCDYAAPAEGKKIIIYPDRVYLHGPVIDFYSLKRMGLTDNVFEVEYKEDCIDFMLEQIMNAVNQ